MFFERILSFIDVVLMSDLVHWVLFYQAGILLIVLVYGWVLYTSFSAGHFLVIHCLKIFHLFQLPRTYLRVRVWTENRRTGIYKKKLFRDFVDDIASQTRLKKIFEHLWALNLPLFAPFQILCKCHYGNALFKGDIHWKFLQINGLKNSPLCKMLEQNIKKSNQIMV